MRQLASFPELRECSKVFLNKIEKCRGLYLCWQESSRLASVKIETSAVGTPQYLKFTGVCEVRALSKYLFAASQNSIFFWSPENFQTPSVFIELSKVAKIVAFTFHEGRFLLLWTTDFKRKAFVTLLNKKAQILAQREICAFSVYDLDFLELPEPPFLIETGAGQAWVSLCDGTLWSASLGSDTLGEFTKVADLHSPAIWISQAADSLRIMSCLGRFYSVSSSIEVHEQNSIAPVLRVFHHGDRAVAVTPSDSFVFSFETNGSLSVNQSKWHDLVSVSSGGAENLICVFRSGKICSCPAEVLFASSSADKESINHDPWETLQKLADLRESRALAQISVTDLVQRQMALLMYLKFNALQVQCQVKGSSFPSLVEDQIVTCDVRTEEPFDPTMWIVSVLLKPHGRDVMMAKSAPFIRRGTSISLQFESPKSLLLNLRVFLSLKSRLLPRTLSLMIHEQDVCLLHGRYGTQSPGFLVHRPSIECCLAQDLPSFLSSSVGDRETCSASDVRDTKLARIVLHESNRKLILSLRSVLIRILMRKTLSTEPKFLVPKSMEQAVKTAREQMQSCDSMKTLLTCFEQWRDFTLKLPIL